MALPSSGPISLADIQTEFGGSNPIGLNEYYAGGGRVPAGTTGTYGAVPSSGAICMNVFHGTSNVVVGQQAYTTAGTYTWVAPAGVTSISFVVVGAGGNGGSYGFCCGWFGGGGGGGGGLAYKNNFAVTPGNSYTVKVRAGGTYCSGSTTEQRSTYFCNSNYGALTGRNGASGGGGGGGGDGGYANCGSSISGFGRGGNGGAGVAYASCSSVAAGGGGGGAAGYSHYGSFPYQYDGSGGGGSGALNRAGTSSTYGGGGGGGINANGSCGAGGGGGVGILGAGANGAGGPAYCQPGYGGSGGARACNGNGGLYGGGGSGLRARGGNTYYLGANGAVRIIWPGTTRSFPSTCTGNL